MHPAALVRVLAVVLALVAGCGSAQPSLHDRSVRGALTRSAEGAVVRSAEGAVVRSAEGAVVRSVEGAVAPSPIPSGPSPQTPGIAARPPDDAPRAWLYRVRDADGTPSYLLGTLHVGVSFTRALPRPLDRTLLEARSIVMEIDIHQAALFLRRPQRTEQHEPRLDRVLEPETWTRLTSELSFVARPSELARLPAGLVASYLRQVRMADVEAEDDGWPRFPGTASPTHLDRWIYDFAMRWSVPFVALETPEQTVRALAGIERESPVRVLAHIVDEPQDARAAARALRNAYLSLDEARVLAAISELSAAERDATFTQRNLAWLERLVPELERGGAFVAVGLGHLLGEGNLLELLRARGYEVERVRGDGDLAPLGPPGEHVWEPARRRPF